MGAAFQVFLLSLAFFHQFPNGPFLWAFAYAQNYYNEPQLTLRFHPLIHNTFNSRFNEWNSRRDMGIQCENCARLWLVNIFDVSTKLFSLTTQNCILWLYANVSSVDCLLFTMNLRMKKKNIKNNFFFLLKNIRMKEEKLRVARENYGWNMLFIFFTK